MLHLNPYTTRPHTPQNSQYPPSYSTFMPEYPHAFHTHSLINAHFPPPTFRNFACKRSRSSTPLQYTKVNPPPISKLTPRFPFYSNITLSFSIFLEIISIRMYLYILHTHKHTYTHRTGSREIWNCSFTNNHADTFRNNPRITLILISEREARMRERDIHTRHWYQDFPCTCMHALSFSHYQEHSHTTQTQKENVCVCLRVLFIKQIRYNTQTQVS
jgi:hypothetical protein